MLQKSVHFISVCNFVTKINKLPRHSRKSGLYGSAPPIAAHPQPSYYTRTETDGRAFCTRFQYWFRDLVPVRPVHSRTTMGRYPRSKSIPLSPMIGKTNPARIKILDQIPGKIDNHNPLTQHMTSERLSVVRSPERPQIYQGYSKIANILCTAKFLSRISVVDKKIMPASLMECSVPTGKSAPREEPRPPAGPHSRPCAGLRNWDRNRAACN